MSRRRDLSILAGLFLGIPAVTGDPVLVLNGAHEVTAAGPSFVLDVNSDGVTDLRFNYNAWEFHTMVNWSVTVERAHASSGTLVRADDGDYVWLVHRYATGTPVSFQPTNGRTSAYACLEDYPVWEGAWLGGQTGLLGFSFLAAGTRHFGWAEMRAQPGSNPMYGSLVITRVAYETEPGVAILAGEALPDESCNAADLSRPFNVLDLADINEFVTAFLNAEPVADLDPDGLHDLGDIIVFVNAFTGGCP